MKITERQCKFGIWAGVVGIAVSILLLIAPFVLSAAKVISGTATQESLVRDVVLAKHLQTVADVTGTVGPLILVASWHLMKQKRKERK